MVDFTKLRSDRKQTVPTDPIAIFQRLPKPPHINDLWDGQSKALASWNERRQESDLVIKLNTGGGKTLVGLLIAQSVLNEIREPVVYLCPNNQLVEQTIEKASEVGLAAVRYGGTELDAEFLNARVILVAPYHALFNGLSRFGVLGSGREPVKLGGVICDDAHSALGVVRAAFTISVTRKDHRPLYDELAGRFRTDFESVGRLGSFDDVVEREDFGVLEVPYPAWLAKENEIRELIARGYAEDFKFALPLLRNYFRLCHALVSAREITITPFQPLVHLFPSFNECRRRVFMSATIADDSSIVRTFDANPKSVGNPIVPASLAGVGERMILAPSLMNLKKKTPLEVTKEIAKFVSEKVAGVAILVQSEARGKEWEDVGTVVIGNAVAQAVKELKSKASRGPFVLASRYDGIDLAGDACRLLVLDGLPTATNSYELFRAEVLRGNSSINVGLAQRIEQAIGRGTRGSGDYCVVFLLGKDLTSWIARSASLALMTPSTRAQVQMGYDISKSVTSPEELMKTVMQCLKRDKDWIRYHAETLADRSERPKVDAQAIEIAWRERAYIGYSLQNDFDEAIRIIRELPDIDGNLDRHIRGWLWQLGARAALVAKQEHLSQELQRQAFSANNLLVPPAVKPKYEPLVEIGQQVGNILDEVTRYALRKGILDEFERTVALLAPSTTSNQFEEGLKRFGELLGFRAQRPEHQFRVGPDVLWLCGSDYGFVIECKHRKDSKNALSKDEHGQLLTSQQWAKDNYAKRKLISFIVHPSDDSTKPASAEKTSVMTLAKLGELIGVARQFYTDLCSSTAQGAALEKVCAELLTKHGLSAEEIAKRFLTTFKSAKSAVIV
jgi:replicative superfamily II helicase